MLKNYLKIALRNLSKYRSYSMINIGGLAIGIASCLLISLFIYDELTFDRMFADAERIYRVNIDNKTAGEVSYYAAVSGPLAEVVQRDYPHAEMVTRFRNMGSILVREKDAEQNVKEEHVIGVDSTFFEMFGLELLFGNEKTALQNPKSIILTKTAAAKYFNTNEAVGKVLLMDNSETYTVTGVIDDLPKNSFLRDHSVFISINSFKDHTTEAWNTWYFPTFVKLVPGAQEKDFQEYLGTVKERYLIPWAMTFVPGLTLEKARESEKKNGDFMIFNATPLTDIHLHSKNREKEFSANSDIQNIYILTVIGIFLLLLASVNFMNLSTAHSLKRAKEVGIRKTLGSNRFGLIGQFLSESGLISILSLFIAIGLSVLLLPYFNALSGKAISIPFNNPLFWIILTTAVAILSLFSGTYPAFFMSRFMPVKALKGNGKQLSGGGGIRNYLVVFQFAVSVLLIACTLVVYQQLNFIQNKDLGYQKDQILIIEDVQAAGKHVESFKQEVKELANVENASLSSYLPTPSRRSAGTYFKEGAAESGEFNSDNAVIIGKWEIDYDYLPTLDIEFIKGRNFDQKFSTDSNAVILNESALAMLGVSAEEAIGMRLTDDFHRPDKENMKYSTVIGVVKNFHFESLRNSIDGMTFTLGSDANKMIVKLQSGEFSETVSSIKSKWEKVAPTQPFNYYFMDESFNSTYEAEQRLGKTFITFTSLSIFIACLGLFGLAVFSTEKRTKEIGIRKVMGATVSSVLVLVSKDFLKLVLIGGLIAIPAAWWAMDRWLQDFSYRINISWWVFALSGLAAILIALVTVSTQALKTAITNPVDSLRNE